MFPRLCKVPQLDTLTRMHLTTEQILATPSRTRPAQWSLQTPFERLPRDQAGVISVFTSNYESLSLVLFESSSPIDALRRADVALPLPGPKSTMHIQRTKASQANVCVPVMDITYINGPTLLCTNEDSHHDLQPQYHFANAKGST
jgi:hypothetical protein